MHIYLKVKCCTLAKEQRIIRRYMASLKKRHGATKAGSDNSKKAYIGLGLHSEDVAYASRLSHLAYGFLRKREYAQMEKACRNLVGEDGWEQIERMVMKYGIDDLRELKQRFAAWKDTAEAYAGEARRELLDKDVSRARERLDKYRAAFGSTAQREAHKKEWFSKHPD